MMIEWIDSLFVTPSAMQTIIVLSLICAVGLALGKLRLWGISLGVTFVFFVGIVAGHYGASVDPQVLSYAETFGLVIFVYTLGLHVGPGFFNSLFHEGLSLNIWGLGVVLVGTLLALGCWLVLPVGLPEMMGVLCGATTNTPALGAAQQTLRLFHLPSDGAALGCAVTYPLGVVGVILAMLLMRRFFVRPSDLEPRHTNENNTYIARFVIVNPALDGLSLARVKEQSHFKFIISRIWRNGEVIVPRAYTELHLNDSVMVVTTEQEAPALEILFGKKSDEDWNKEEIDWNAIDAQVESRVIVVTRPDLNGKILGHLQLRNTYGVTVSRVIRGDVCLLATDNLRLQYGDRVTVVGEAKNLDNVEAFLGNTVQSLNEPNLGAIYFGIVLGLVLGAIPLHIPGMSVPVRMGIAGGPIVLGILVGAFGPRFHIITYTTRSANLMLRKLGLSMYLACLGLESGGQFFETVIRPEGLLWVGLGFVLTVVPVLVVGLIALRTRKFDFGTICGILCGSMANPMALTYANDTIQGDTPSVSYTTVYPLCMFMRVIIAQMVLMFLL